MGFYDGTKLLSMRDLNGLRPEAFICTSNRLAGKTTFANRWRIKKFIKNKSKTIWLYRFQSELEDCHNGIFANVGSMFFPGFEMTSKIINKKYALLSLNEEECGYAIAINSADSIRKISGRFYDADWIIFDEFQPESNRYCSGEITKFLSLHKSLARGGKKFAKYLPILMMSNAVTILNPYYDQMGISATLRLKDKYKRGNGYVLEQFYSKEAHEALLSSGISSAFSRDDYIAYAGESKYLLDNVKFVRKFTGKKQYNATIYFRNNCYGCYVVDGGLYMSSTGDNDYYRKIAATQNDIDIGTVYKKECPALMSYYRKMFNGGQFYFSDTMAKQACLSLLTYGA